MTVGVALSFAINSQDLKRLGNGMFWFADDSDRLDAQTRIPVETCRLVCHSQVTVYQECAVKITGGGGFPLSH